jgi:hypothetical protein
MSAYPYPEPFTPAMHPNLDLTPAAETRALLSSSQFLPSGYSKNDSPYKKSVFEAYHPSKMLEGEAWRHVLSNGMSIDEEMAYMSQRFPQSLYRKFQSTNSTCDYHCSAKSCNPAMRCGSSCT